MKIQETVTNVTSVFTGLYAVANIQEILSVVILILSILNILWNMGYRIYTHIKNKRYEKISQEIETAKDELSGLKKEE